MMTGLATLLIPAAGALGFSWGPGRSRKPAQTAIAASVGRTFERTHRPALKTLLEHLDGQATATNEPQRIECGSPCNPLVFPDHSEVEGLASSPCSGVSTLDPTVHALPSAHLHHLWRAIFLVACE